MWEEVVNNELIKRGIDNISRLNIRDLSDAFGITLFFWNCSPRIIKHSGAYYCVLDAKKPDVLQYEDFLHEICHVIFDEHLLATKKKELYINKERKIDFLVPLVAIPKFALDHIRGKTIWEISEEFNISHNLVRRRIEHIKSKMILLKKEVKGWLSLENVKEKME